MGTPTQRMLDAARVGLLLVATPRQAWRNSQLAAAMGVPVRRVSHAVSLLRVQGALVPTPNAGRFAGGVTAREGWEPQTYEVPAVVAPKPEISMSMHWMRELMDLHQLSIERSLSHEESERLGTLIQREQRTAAARPARMAALRAELELLETFEMAARGAVAEGSAKGEPVDLRPSDAGIWEASERRAA